MSTTTMTTALAVPPKLSRYNSLRGRSVSEDRHRLGSKLLKGEEQRGIASAFLQNVRNRSRSRSRSRSRTVVPGNGKIPIGSVSPSLPDGLDSIPPVPPLPQLPVEKKRAASRAPRAIDELEKSSVRYETLRPSASPAPPAPSLRGIGAGPPPRVPLPTRVAIGDAGVVVRSEAAIPQKDSDRRQFSFDQARQRHQSEEEVKKPEVKDEDEAARWADEVARLEAETDRILAEQRKKDLARLQKQLEVSSAKPSIALAATKVKSPVFERFTFLIRSRRANAATLSPPSSTCDSIDFSRATSLEPNLLSKNFKNLDDSTVAAMAPNMDSPISASNNETERRVVVRCRGVTLSIPVDVSTSAVNLLSDFSGHIPHSINAETSVIIETYAQLGLERRLRWYERVRDVMNSWDRDTQNTLLILPDSSEPEKDLELGSVPVTDEPPAGFVLQLYYSQRPGKWDKRFITLLDNGQVLSSKKQHGPATGDKDVHSICHLSDFDIYTPTEAHLRKQIKPPKKHCYAIKSQQKTTLFVNAENYVHIFCTEDPNLAKKFHAGVQAWRSWYLVNRMLPPAPSPKSSMSLRSKTSQRSKVILEKVDENPPQIVSVKHSPRKSVSHVKVQGHKVRVSVDNAPYALGEFTPLMDMDRFNKPLDEFGKDWVPESSRQSLVAGKALAATASAPNEKEKEKNGEEKTDQSAKNSPLVSLNEGSEFASKSLLGSAYDQRMRVKMVEERRPSGGQGQAGNASDGPFTQGPSLLNRTVEPNAPKGQVSRQTSTSSSATKSSPVSDKRFETSPWSPSATQHAADPRLRSVSQRSAPPGIQSGYDREREPQSRYRRPQAPLSSPPPPLPNAQQRMPSPLINLGPGKFESPTWSRDGIGHGVKAPSGARLIDMATTLGSAAAQGRMRDMPAPRNPLRRDTAPTQLQRGLSTHEARPTTAGRQRSGTTSNASLRRGELGPGVPAVPSLPIRSATTARTGAQGSQQVPRDPRQQRPSAGSQTAAPTSSPSDQERGRQRMRGN